MNIKAHIVPYMYVQSTHTCIQVLKPAHNTVLGAATEAKTAALI
jgi:hypothetical protein